MTSTPDPRATSFGENTNHYDTARPPYPTWVIEQITLGARRGRALDIGCGTGTCALTLTERGWHVLGIEPDGRMAARARDRGIPVVESTFEAWEPHDARFDLVLSAQSWHWIDRAVGANKAAAILATSGRFAAVWNSHHHEPEVAQRIRRVYDRYRDHVAHLPRPATAPGDVIDLTEADLNACPTLTNVERRSTTTPKEYTIEDWLNVQQSFGSHLVYPLILRERILHEISQALETFGTIPVAWTTTLITATPRCDEPSHSD